MNRIKGQRKIFAITWVTYAGYYLCRKNLSVVLPLLHGASGLSNIDLANIIFGYSLLYVIGQFGWGFLADRIGAKRVVGAGLLLVICSNLLMGVHASFLWLLFFACLNGAAQSTGWSGLVKTMAVWFGRESRGVVMAWWGTNYVFGGFLATTLATWAIAQPYFLPQLGWRRGFLFPSVLLIFITVIFLAGVSKAPKEAEDSQGQEEALDPQDGRTNWSDLAALLRKPSLWMVSISYFFLELCRYALLFWLPLYMVDHLKYSLEASGYVSSCYELVGILGALAAGYVSDRFVNSKRAPVCAVMLYGLGLVMLLQPVLSGHGLVGTAIAISAAGVLSYGPDTMLSGSVAQDIGEAKAAATASGLIEGIGHLGSLFSPYLVVYVSGRYGWDRLFLVFAAAAFLAGVVLMPMWNQEPAIRRELTVKDKAMQRAN